jgi:hypothetical protein
VLVEVHGAIVADDVVLVWTDELRRVIPIAGALNVRFIERLAIDFDVALSKGDRLTWQTHNPLAEHVTPSRIANRHDIAALGWAKDVRKAIDEIDAVFFIGRQHAYSFDANREEDVSPKDNDENNPNDSAE